MLKLCIDMCHMMEGKKLKYETIGHIANLKKE